MKEVSVFSYKSNGAVAKIGWWHILLASFINSSYSNWTERTFNVSFNQMKKTRKSVLDMCFFCDFKMMLLEKLFLPFEHRNKSQSNDNFEQMANAIHGNWISRFNEAGFCVLAISKAIRVFSSIENDGGTRQSLIEFMSVF